jgi:hypothetical protein
MEESEFLPVRSGGGRKNIEVGRKLYHIIQFYGEQLLTVFIENNYTIKLN